MQECLPASSPQPSVLSGPGHRIPELDGIRGIAILLVLIAHFCSVAGLPAPLAEIFGVGWIGVDLFFVLSGFLITGILLKSKGNPGYFRTFYRNRTLRIFPLYYVCLVAASIADPEWRQIVYWAYLGNFLSAAGHPIPFIRHFWSLAIEEQFYLAWPVVVWYSSTRKLTAICGWAIGCVATARFAFVLFPLPSREFIYAFTPLRCDALLFGALIACLHHRSVLLRLGWLLKLTALAGFCVFCFGAWRGHGMGHMNPGMERYGYFGMDLLFASAVAACALRPGDSRFSLLRTGALRFFGKYSYAIYLFHYPISRVLRPWVSTEMNPAIAAVASFSIGTALSAGLALISWNLIEKRCLAYRRESQPIATAANV